MPATVSRDWQDRGLRRPILSIAGLVLCCMAALALLIALRPAVPGPADEAAMLDAILLWHSLLPRAAVALVAGGALGLSGALLQRVLRNPIADPSTLGIAAGAQLALTIGLGLFPALAGLPRETVAFAGGLCAVAIVLALSWRRGLDPVTMALCGMVVTLVASALGVTLILARGEYALSIHIWGAGALGQQSWHGVLSLAPRLALGLLAALLLLRPLSLMALDDSSARGLGLRLHLVRFAVVALAVWLAASVTAEVGVIGFLGLAAPAIARLLGARTTGAVLAGSLLVGAAMLFLTDAAMQLLGEGFADLAPAGAATALLGGPLLLLLLPRLRATIVAATAPTPDRGLARPGRSLLVLAGILLIVTGFALILGRTGEWWTLALGQDFAGLLPFRLPRVVTAAGAGAMLAAAGFVLQKITANPIASPDVLGVSAGGGVGLVAVLFLFAFPSPPVMLAATVAGALLAFLVLMAVAARSGFGPDRLVLAGIAVSATCMAVITLVIARGDLRGYVLLTWLAGSTNRAGAFEAWLAAGGAILLIAPLPFLARWLAILPLGSGPSTSLGLAVGASRLTLAVLAAAMTALASHLVGPLSLTGLVAPHLSRLAGFRGVGAQLAASILFGAGLLVLADWLSRIAIYPYQIPVGLFAALIGGPYLVWLLTRRNAPA